MFNLLKIAGNAFREAIREPVFCLMLLGALLLIGNLPGMAIFTFAEQVKLVVDSAMAVMLTFGLIVSVLSAGSTIAREMRNGTVLLLLSKPVGKCTFILGKVLGIALAAVLFSAVCGAGTVLAVYVAIHEFHLNLTVYYSYFGLVAAACAGGMAFNFWRGGSFSEGTVWLLTLLMPACAVVCAFLEKLPENLVLSDLLSALILIGMAAVLMAILAAALATRLDVVPDLCVCCALFFGGLVSGYLFSQFEEGSLLAGVGSWLGTLLPNWQYFWLADAVATGRAIPLSYLGTAALYVALYGGLVCTWAALIFRDQETAGSRR